MLFRTDEALTIALWLVCDYVCDVVYWFDIVVHMRTGKLSADDIVPCPNTANNVNEKMAAIPV